MAILSKRRADAKEAFNTLVTDVKDNGLRATLKDRGVKGFVKEGISEPVMALILIVFALGIAVFILVPIWNNITSGNDSLSHQMDDRFGTLMGTDVKDVKIETPTPDPEGQTENNGD